ncbi:MAG: hypothetical protein HC795_01160 [Coleofasciculaceae cyanobacterium RL_1_1]|nr:hypothetical protein [Coleofasciculaceae cyanobacterium RL_1_1]
MNPQDKRFSSESIRTQQDWRIRPPVDDRPHLWRWITIAMLLIGLKLWLVAHLPIRALDADRDNLRYVILATNLIHHDTTYDAFALLRQPGYPLLIAVAHWLGIPLRLWQEAIYLTGGAFLAAIVGGVYRRPRLATLGFALYALAPFSFHWNRQTLQEVLYLPLMAAWLGCAIAVVECRGLRWWLGALGGGTVLAGLWNTRPEGVLMVPPIMLVWAIVGWRRYQAQREALRRADRDRLEAEYRDQLEAEAARQDRIEREIEAQLEAQLNGVILPPLPELPALSEFQVSEDIHQDQAHQAESSGAESQNRGQASEKINIVAIARELLIGLGLTIVPVTIVTLGICWSNAANFGIFVTSDFKTPEFAAAYSALSRVEGSSSSTDSSNSSNSASSTNSSNPANSSNSLNPSNSLNSSNSSTSSPSPNTIDTAAIVPVPASARAAIYDHSPAFRELRPALEVPPNTGWRSQSCAEGICDDYAGGFFFWALRDAAAAAGYYETPDRAAAFYRQLAAEINAACDDGVLRCRSGLWGMVPALRWQTIPRWLGSMGRLTRQLGRTAIVLKLDSPQDAETIALRQRYYEPIIGEPAEFVTQRSRPENQRKDAAISFGADLYRLIFPIVIGLSVLGIAIESGMQLGQMVGATGTTSADHRRPRRPRRSNHAHDRSRSNPALNSAQPQSTHASSPMPLSLVCVAIVAIAVRVMTIAYIDVTSWPVGSGDRYLRPLWPLLWFIILAGLAYAVDRWRQILRPKL